MRHLDEVQQSASRPGFPEKDEWIMLKFCEVFVLITEHTFHGIPPELKGLLSRCAGAALDDEIHVAR